MSKFAPEIFAGMLCLGSAAFSPVLGASPAPPDLSPNASVGWIGHGPDSVAIPQAARADF